MFECGLQQLGYEDIRFMLVRTDGKRFIMPFPFDVNLDRKLIQMVKETPILYDPNDPKYVDVNLREVAWQKIGDTLGRPPAMCKSRWVNIRDMMRRKVRERRNNPKKGYLYKYETELSFMIPYFREASNSYTECFDEDKTDEDCDSNDIKPSLAKLKKTIESADVSFLPTIFLDENFSTEKRKDILEVNQELNPTDPIDVYLMTIGSTLRKLKPLYLNQAKSKIFQVVQDFEYKQIVDDEPVYSGHSRDKE